MACQVSYKKLRLLRPVQWFFTIIVITICSHTKPCICSSSSNHDRIASYSWNTSFQQMNGLLFLLKNNSDIILQQGSLGNYIGMPNPGFDLKDHGWFLILKWFDPWKTSQGEVNLNETVSFSIVFTLSAVSTIDPLLFDILPRLEPPDDTGTAHNGPTTRGDIVQNFTNTLTITSLPPNGTRVTATFSSSTSTYSMRINYDRGAHNLSVYLVSDADVGTTAATRQLDAGDTLNPDALLFAITSSMGQLLELYNWNFTIKVRVTEQSRGANIATVVSSVLGSAAATAAIAAAVYFYLNSQYRRWKKDLDKLAKTMQSLPGVPMKVDFADIKKATNSFHETMRLGQGGFGAVYRCRLPAPKKGKLMEVAIKKFTRADSQGYEDFLAEVSIINRLRHKNIVPLVGWSYNRGEHILISEYMPNGSLDQHLFRRSSDEQQATCISQWGTRYNLVKDIASGLQYVHHEYEPMVLHRDIKASNIMIDFTFQGRLGDFGLACALADGKDSYTDHGAPGTLGFRAPEYVYSGRATRKTDTFAFGVLVLEIVTGKRAVGRDLQFSGHVTDWVWKFHAEGNLLGAVDAVLATNAEFDADEAIRLLRLGMACSSPNPSDRPSMADAVQIISKSVPPPDIPLSKPPLVWPPEGWGEPSSTSDYSTSSTSNFNTTSTFMVEMMAGTEYISSNHEHGRLTGYSRKKKTFAGGSLRLSL